MDELEKKDELEKEQELETEETESVSETIEEEPQPAGEETIAEEEPAEGEAAAEEEQKTEDAAAEETETAEEAAEPAVISAEEKKEEKEGSHIIGIIIGLAAFIAILVYCWMLPGGGTVQDTGVLYAKDNDLYFYDLKNDPYLLQESISDGGSYHYFYTAWGAGCTEEGHWAYFLDDIDETGGFNLYRKDTKDASAEAELIDNDVYDYMSSKNGEVVAYLKGKDEAMELCTFDGTEVQTIQDGIHLENQVYALSGDGKYLAFMDAYGMLNATVVGEGDAVPLTDGAETYSLAEETGILYFVAKGTEGYNIYSYAFDGNEPALVAEDISSMEMMPNGKDLLYCKAPKESVLYSDIIVDDMAESDAALTEADGEAYEKKLQRDTIREAIANGEGFEPLLQECYVLTGGKSVLVANDVVSAIAVENDRPYVIGYKAKEFTPLRLSVIDGGLDMVEYIYYMSLSYGGVETFLTDTAGNLEALTGYSVQPDSLKLSKDGRKAAYLTSDPNTGGNILMEMEIGKAAEASAVAMDVENFAFVGGNLFYYYDYANGEGTLAMAGGETTIAGACGVQYADDAVYYIADADSTTGNGQLRYWNGTKETVIGENAFAFQYKGNGKLAYISGYDVNEGLGDLYYYNGKEPRLLDTDVTALFIY
ncbi:hypothetical protein [Anaerotignum sp.]